MAGRTTRGVKEGIGFGLIAGAIFAVVEVMASAAMGNPPLTPFRMFASIVAGEGALQTMSVGAAFIIGLIVHFVLAAAFGLIYGLVNSRFSAETQTGWGPQVGLGLLYGALLWLVNFQIIARLAYPWFLEAPQLMQLLMHAIFFGLPLSLMYAAAERRVHPARKAPTPA